MTAPPLDLCGAPLVETTTGLQRTTVHRGAEDGDFWWWHRPGPGRSAAITLAPAARHLTDLTGPATGPATGAAVLAVGRPHLDGLLHRAPGPRSAAGWLRDFRPEARTLVAHAVAAAGRTLGSLHRVPVDTAGTGTTTTPGLSRLRRWLDGEERSTGASRLRDLAGSRWGAARWGHLGDWADDATRAGTTVLVHGWASVGALVPPLHPGPPALLTGEDLGLGRPELDLGWMLGDLAELAWRMPHLDLQDPSCAGLARAFLAAYGPDVDRAAAARCAVLRVVTHMQDHATYQPWTEELQEYLDFAAALIDDEGSRTIPEEGPRP